MSASRWRDVFGEVPGGVVRCIGQRRNGQTGSIRDCSETIDGEWIYLIQWDNDHRDSWKPERVLQSADPRFPMPEQKP